MAKQPEESRDGPPPDGPGLNLSPVGARIVAAIEEAIEAMRAGRPLKTTFHETHRGRGEGEQTITSDPLTPPGAPRSSCRG